MSDEEFSISRVHTHRKLNAFMFEHVSERNTDLPCLYNLTDNFEDKMFVESRDTRCTQKFEKDIEDGQTSQRIIKK